MRIFCIHFMEELKVLNLQTPLPVIIPAISNTADFVAFLDSYADPWVMVKLGDINTLPNIVRRVHEKRKKIIVHNALFSARPHYQTDKIRDWLSLVRRRTLCQQRRAEPALKGWPGRRYHQ